MVTLTENDLLPQAFYRHAEERPDAPYLHQPVGGGRVETYTFKQTLDEARKMAGHLSSLGLPANSRIAILSKNCAHFFITDLAIWMAGHVSVALYPTLTAEIVQYILEHSESRLLFVGKLDTWEQMKPGVPDDMPKIAFPLAPPTDCPDWDGVANAATPMESLARRSADEESIIIYTSGSTGRPKGVLHTFQSIAAPTVRFIDVFDVSPTDRVLSYLPLAHGMDRWLSEVISMTAGSQVFFPESLDTFVEDLRRAQPTMFVSVPRLWLKFQLGVFNKMPPKKLERLKKIPILGGVVKKKVLSGLGLDKVRFAGSGSAPIPAELLQWYRDLGLELLEGYGMTENFNYSHVTRLGQGRAGYIGHPYPDVECRLSDEGEILVKSPGDMKGYYKEPELTREAYTDDGFLKTGDLGEIDDEGRLRITGRVKDIFKTSKGKYVAPVPIENMLNADNNIELCCVAGGNRPATLGLVQLAEELLPTADTREGRAQIERELGDLLDRVNEHVPVYERMKFLVVTRDRWTVENGYLTPTMKIKRSVIEKRYAPFLDEWYGSGKQVIWQE
jgi:long-subunit acyl-CoA synthetase (AMP-forming)